MNNQRGEANTALDPNNRWVRMEGMIPWRMLEAHYGTLFRDAPHPLRVALAVCMIQAKYDYTGEETIRQIDENPYLRHFCGYAESAPALSEPMLDAFWGRISPEMITHIRRYVRKFAAAPDKRAKNAVTTQGAPSALPAP